MNFQCEELSISDGEFGFTITFSDSKSSDDQFKSVEEIMNSGDKYLLIQRSYPEEENDLDYYYIESSETDTEFSPKDKMIVRLSQQKFEIDWSGDHLEIGLNLTDKEQESLKEAFEIVFKERTTLLK
jgi:ATP-dependent phosphoenolpyruvate carboxykinase